MTDSELPTKELATKIAAFMNQKGYYVKAQPDNPKEDVIFVCDPYRPVLTTAQVISELPSGLVEKRLRFRLLAHEGIANRVEIYILAEAQ